MSVPAFKRISTTFQIGKQKYYGMGIASPEAMYLVMTTVRSDLASGLAGGLGGALGGLVVGALGRLGARQGQPVQTCAVGELDAEIRQHPDWPLRGKDRNQVLVIPQGTVELLEHPSFTNLLKFKIGEVPVTVEYLLFRGAGIRDYLGATGWPVKWRGRMLTEVQTQAT